MFHPIHPGTLTRPLTCASCVFLRVCEGELVHVCEGHAMVSVEVVVVIYVFTAYKELVRSTGSYTVPGNCIGELMGFFSL